MLLLWQTRHLCPFLVKEIFLIVKVHFSFLVLIVCSVVQWNINGNKTICIPFLVPEISQVCSQSFTSYYSNNISIFFHIPCNSLFVFLYIWYWGSWFPIGLCKITLKLPWVRDRCRASCQSGFELKLHTHTALSQSEWCKIWFVSRPARVQSSFSFSTYFYFNSLSALWDSDF